MDQKATSYKVSGGGNKLNYLSMLKEYGINTMPTCKNCCAVCKHYKFYESVEGICDAHDNIKVDQWYWCESKFELSYKPV